MELPACFFDRDHGSYPGRGPELNYIPIQAERTAAFILHAYGDTSVLPTEHEMMNFFRRAKYELNRISEIQKDLVDEGEPNAYRAYSMVGRLVSIEGRLYFEALQKGGEPLHPSFDARRVQYKMVWAALRNCWAAQ